MSEEDNRVGAGLLVVGVFFEEVSASDSEFFHLAIVEQIIYNDVIRCDTIKLYAF